MNLIFQYYIPYEANDVRKGGATIPNWAKAGSRSAQEYAEKTGAEYMLSQERHFPHLDPRLDSLRLIYDESYDKYDKILCIDLDILLKTDENIFDFEIGDIAMVHEVGIFNNSAGNWIKRVMDVPGYQRGIIAYGKSIFGEDWMFPKSTLYPQERFRYMNGGVQLWSREGRQKARKHFTCVDDYYTRTRQTEQMYINLQLSNPVFEVTELDQSWNSIATRQWCPSSPRGKFQHFINDARFVMESFV